MITAKNGIVIAVTLLIIIVTGFVLRFRAVEETVVIVPIRADARQHYFYAVNLKDHGIYSLQVTNPESDIATIKPDQMRMPGYSLFILPFIEYPPTQMMLRSILRLQVVISMLTLLFAVGLFRAFLPWPLALLGAGLVALSPHLISINTYLLTESLFTFFLVVTGWIITRIARHERAWLGFMLGLAVGMGLLVRPTLSYFPLFLIPLLFSIKKERRVMIAVTFVIGFYSAYGPWLIRNLSLEEATGSGDLQVGSVHLGIYPDLMYKNNPKSLGIPYRFDPTWNDRTTMPQVIDEVKRRFIEDPVGYSYWYLIGKPKMFFSWSIIAGMGDVFIYPIRHSPYLTDRFFIVTHVLMHAIHWPLVILALYAMIAVWLPGSQRSLPDTARLPLRYCSLLLIYFIAVHIAAGPLPRYSMPLLPITFGMAMFGLYLLNSVVRQMVNREKIDEDH